MREQKNSNSLQLHSDLFGNPIPRTQEPKVVKEKRAGLRVRVLEFFKTKKYQSFTVAEVVALFPGDKPESVTRAVYALKKTSTIITTGQSRGNGIDNQCLTLNLHKR